MWSRRAVDKKDVFPRRNHVVHCTKTWKLNAEMAACRTNVLCTTAFLRRQRRRNVMPSAMPRWRRRHIEDVTSSSSRRRRVKKDNTSRNHYWQNDSLFAEIVDLFILLTPLHSTTFKTEVSTWYIATHVHDHDSLTTWVDGCPRLN